MSHPLVSIVVVTHNDEALVTDCLAALERTRYAPYEVIFVDNASSDATVAVLKISPLVSEVLVNPVGQGPARANNQGAVVAKGELLVFMNPDVFVTPDWLDVLVRHIEERPDVAILCARTLYPGEPLRDSSEPVEEQAAVPGCAMMVRRRAWEELDGFDEHYFIYWDDTDLCWRAWLLGWRVLGDLQAQVYHEQGGSTRGKSWAGEQIKNGLYTHLKLMRWRLVAVYALLMVAKTVVMLPSAPKLELLGAWAWNLRNIRPTLAKRRACARRRRRPPAEIEPLIKAHGRRQLRERLERRRALRHAGV